MFYVDQNDCTLVTTDDQQAMFSQTYYLYIMFTGNNITMVPPFLRQGESALIPLDLLTTDLSYLCIKWSFLLIFSVHAIVYLLHMRYACMCLRCYI